LRFPSELVLRQISRPSNRSSKTISPPTASPGIQMQPSDELPEARKSTKMVVATVVPIVTLLVLGVAALLWLRRRRRLKMYEFALDHQVRPFRLTVDTRPSTGTSSAMSPIASTSRPMPFVKERR
jgi:hypothetical protein